MTDEWRLPWSAACLCGAVQMRVTQPPLLSFACHCGGCKKLTSSAYSISFVLPADGFMVVAGDTVLGGARAEHAQHFCDACKSWLFTRPAGVTDYVNVRATLLEDPSWVVPFVDVYTAAKLPSVVTGAELRFDDAPTMDDFPVAAAAFAERSVRPTTA